MRADGKRHDQRLIPIWLVCAVLLSSACAAKLTVKQLMADPGQYRGKSVTLTGVVDKPVAVAGQGVYRLTDGDAGVWVKTTKGVPQPGTVAQVTGKIYDAYDLGGVPLPLPEGVRKGVILVESSRTATSPDQPQQSGR